eukprot:211509-Pyramimonas_sp.AAC.1
MGLTDQILEESDDETYRFGNGGAPPSKLRVTAPLALCGQAGRVVFSVVDSVVLIGRDFTQPSMIDISLWRGPDPRSSCSQRTGGSSRALARSDLTSQPADLM